MKFQKANELPIPEKEYLWQYLDLHEFLYFLLEQKLFFKRLDKLSDPNEGVPYKYLIALHGTKSPGGENWEKYREKLWNDLVPQYQKGQFVNCWYLGNRESVAMWNLYSGPSGFEINIVANQLINHVKKKVLEVENSIYEKMLYGLVDYRNLNPFDLNEYYQNIQSYEGEETGVKKDKSYDHEREFRFWAVLPHGINKMEEPPEYFQLDISPVEEISFQIIHHPEMKPWQVKNLRKLLAIQNLETRLKVPDTEIRKICF